MAEVHLVQNLAEQLPATEVVGPRWFSYNEHTGCWEDNVKDDYRRLVLQLINPIQRKASLARQVLDHFQDTIRTKSNFYGAIKPDGPDAVLINTLNKVLRVDRSAIQVLDHDMEFRFTRSLEVDYDPAAVNELFERERPRVLPDPLDQELYQLLGGNIFIPDARYEVFTVMYGEAGTGKDTIMAPITALFGKPERGLLTTYSINQLSDSHSYALPQLQFASLNVCSELNSREVEDSSTFKQLVSGIPISTRILYDMPFSMTTACKLFFLSNNMPAFRFGTAAEGRRLRGLRTTSKPDKVDVTVKQRLLVPHPGTLNWLLTGLQKLLNMGTQSIPLGGQASQEMHAQFATSNDPVNDFLKACCEIGTDHQCLKSDMVRAFKGYASDNDLSKRLADNFFKMLYNRYPNLGKKRGSAGTTRVQLITGIKLNAEGTQIALETPPSLDELD